LVSGDQFATDVTLLSGGSLRLAPNANLDADNLLVGSGATFTQDAGSEIYLGRDLTNNGGSFVLAPTSEVAFGLSAPIPHFINGTTGITFQNLTLGEQFADGQLTCQVPVRVQRMLEVDRNGTVNANGQLTLLSDASGTALLVNKNGGTVSGNLTVQRYLDGSLNPGLGYRHLTPPVTTTLADLVAPGLQPEISQAATYNNSATPGTTTPFPTLFFYNQSRLTSATNNYAAFDKGFQVPLSLSETMESTRGYAVQASGGTLLDFVGVANQGAVSGRVLKRELTGPNAPDAG
jgi:hypothetical protein